MTVGLVIVAKAVKGRPAGTCSVKGVVRITWPDSESPMTLKRNQTAFTV